MPKRPPIKGIVELAEPLIVEATAPNASLTNEKPTLFSMYTEDGKIVFEATPKQTRVVLSRAVEILAGGQRGGAKSFSSYLFIGKGNQIYNPRIDAVMLDPNTDPKWPGAFSYLNLRSYRALVLRRNATDLKDWCDKFEELWKRAFPRMKSTDDPPIFVFPTGAKVYTNHLQNEDALDKYKGWELHRIVVEELTQIPEAKYYLKLKGSLRSSDPQIHPQIFSTTNPDGPGSAWVCERFVDVFDNKGTMVPHGSIIRDTVTGTTRVFFPMKLEENPYLDTPLPGQKLSTYRANLMDLDPETRAAWLEGDWHAFSAMYFSSMFRPDGPKPGDKNPENARHVLPASAMKIQPWWTRWIGMDWGFSHNCAVYWGAKSPQGQTIIYRELVLKGTSSYDVGAETARRSIQDLAGLPGHSMNVYLSPDVMAYDDESHSIGNQICAGFNSILGENSTVIENWTAQEKALRERAPDLAAKAFAMRIAALRDKASIMITRASNDRVGGWNHMRTMMRWWTSEVPEQGFNLEAAKEILHQHGEYAYEQYLERIQRAKTQEKKTLPGLIILENCGQLIRAIKNAKRDPLKPEDITKKHWDGADSCDAARYLCAAERDGLQVQPKDYFISERLERAKEAGLTEINAIIQVRQKAEADYNASVGTSLNSFTLPRASMPPRDTGKPRVM